MATSYKIRLKRFNGTDYDTLNLTSDNIIMSSGNNLQTDYNNLDGAIDDIVYVGDDAPTDPNTKIWLDTDASGASAVNSVNGKSGTVVLDANDVGATPTWTLLWENASPTSNFVDQTLQVTGIGSYDEYMFIVKETTSALMEISCYTTKPTRTFQIFAFVLKAVRRPDCSFSANSLTIGRGAVQNTYGTWTDGNNNCIPIRIYGR